MLDQFFVNYSQQIQKSSMRGSKTFFKPPYFTFEFDLNILSSNFVILSSMTTFKRF